MPLVSRSGLVKENAIKVSITMVFTCPLLFWCKVSSPLKENFNVVIIFPFPFHIFMPFANLWIIRLQEYFPILRTRSCTDLYPLIRPLGRPLALGKGRIIPRFNRSPPTLAV